MSDAGTITLRARIGRPLDDPAIRDLVAATAVAIGERHGVRVRVLETTGDAMTISVEGGDLAAVGLAAELRRTTDRWHRGRHGVPLWSGPGEDGDGG